MRTVYIEYNPYRLETNILIDGKAPKQNSKLCVGEKRLQEWIEDLPEILVEECSTHEFDIAFHGTTLDYEDVESVVEDANHQGLHIELTHEPAKEVVDKEDAISDIFDEIQNGPFEELKEPAVVDAFNSARSSDFKVNVIATMSAGKSTLINALLRKKLMPSKQEACTATITTIKDTDRDDFSCVAKDKEGDIIEEEDNISLDDMKRLNENSDVSTIEIEGNIPFVSSKDIDLVLVDTPGTNNSRDPEHRATTYRMLSESSKPVVLYILNATQPETDDDKRLLTHVADSMKVKGKQSKDRFIFVINKMDDFKKDDDSVVESIERVRDYLKINGIENANIYPASALTALDIRTILKNDDGADGDDVDDDIYDARGKVRKFNRNEERHFEQYAPLPRSVKKEIQSRLEEARSQGDKKAEALIHCGIVPIEMAIQLYVRKYAKTAKIKNIVDTFAQKLDSAQSFELVKKNITENQQKQKEILSNIEAIQKKISSGKDAKRFQEKIEQVNYDGEIRKRANDVIMEAQKQITAQLSSGDTKISKGEAEEICKQFARFADNLQAEVQVKLEDLIENHVHKNANNLLEEYKKKLSELAQDVKVGGVPLDSFALMAGDISTDVSSLIKNLTETESVKVDEVWVENTKKKWYKPWTWFQEKGHWKSIYEDKEYVDGTKLAQQFFAPIQEQLYQNSDSAITYAKAQTVKIKRAFSQKFAELDMVLKQKLQELEECAKNNQDVERRIQESQDKLKWLEGIQTRVKSILDI